MTSFPETCAPSEHESTVLLVNLEEWHNTPIPRNPVWHKDYFDLKAIEKKLIQESLIGLPLFA